MLAYIDKGIVEVAELPTENIHEARISAVVAAGQYKGFYTREDGEWVAFEQNLEDENQPDRYNEGYQDGKQAEYDAFWDAVQYDVGDYNYLFAGRGWNDTTFKPKYNILTNETPNRMFVNCKISDLEGILQKQGVTLDTSRATRFDEMFYFCTTLTTVPEIKIGASCNTFSQMFGSCRKLKTIRKLTFLGENPATSNTGNMFYNCTALENIEVSGTIAMKGLNFQWCPLTHNSLMSIITALKQLPTGTTGYTITLGADNLDKLSYEEKEMINEKGWTYA